MRILANQKTRHLFCWILLLITLSSSFSIVVVGLQWNGAVLYLFTSAICMGSLILTVLYLYFREQEQMIEHAVMQILESLSGNQNARIDCDDEGELYRLFHEINSLVAILNTHIENEKNTKYFLKDTISNISHQLKTPLTTLNIYNGLLQNFNTLSNYWTSTRAGVEQATICYYSSGSIHHQGSDLTDFSHSSDRTRTRLFCRPWA